MVLFVVLLAIKPRWCGFVGGGLPWPLGMLMPEALLSLLRINSMVLIPSIALVEAVASVIVVASSTVVTVEGLLGLI